MKSDDIGNTNETSMDEDVMQALYIAQERELNREDVRQEVLRAYPNWCPRKHVINEFSRTNRNIKFSAYRRRNAIMHIAALGIATAAILIVGFEITNRTYPVSADPDTGFFHWLKKDHTGVSFITNPQGGNKTVEVENITDEYLLEVIGEGYFIPTTLPAGMGLYSISYTPESENYKAYYTDGSDYVEIGSLPRKGYDPEEDGYDYYGSMFMASNISEFYTKGKETLGAYPFRNRMYYVKGNLENGEIQNITIEMAKHLKGDADEE